jgi:hypothetical protein
MTTTTQDHIIGPVNRPAAKFIARIGCKIGYGIAVALTGLTSFVILNSAQFAAGDGAKALCMILGGAAAAGTFHAVRKGFSPEAN